MRERGHISMSSPANAENVVNAPSPPIPTVTTSSDPAACNRPKAKDPTTFATNVPCGDLRRAPSCQRASVPVRAAEPNSKRVNKVGALHAQDCASETQVLADQTQTPKDKREISC